MHKIQPLVFNDKIAILSTARKINEKELNFAKQTITNWGLIPIESPNLRAQHHQFCGTDEQRASDFNWAIHQKEIKAILCFRGGYGSVRILESIDWNFLQQFPKWVIGYSDITALHNAINQLGLPSLHATMPINFSHNTQEALQSLKHALLGKKYSIETHPSPFNRLGNVEAEIVGGNLSILYSLSGTKYDIDTRGKILFIEDLDEYLYHIDRMLWNLKLSGKLAHLKGLIIGGMTNMHDNDIPFGMDVKQIILEITKEYNYPICFDFPAGHIDDNRALILGKKCKLKVQKETVKLLF